MDVIISVIAIMIMIGAVIIVAYKLNTRTIAAANYGGIVFGNIERMDAATSFLHSYKINSARLDTFKSSFSQATKQEILQGTGYSGKNELCIFFLDQATPMDISGSTEIGYAGCSYNEPCAGYDKASVNVKPVLMENEIVNMYVVVCS